MSPTFPQAALGGGFIFVSGTPGLGPASDDSLILEELDGEDGLITLLTGERYKGQASGPTEEAHHAALRFLRCRAGSQPGWLS